MKPKVGQKLTYVDEGFVEYTAIVTEIFTHENHQTLSIEYKHEDRSTRKVTGVPFVDGAHNVDSTQKVMCFSKRTPKKSTKKPEPAPAATTATPPDASTTSTSGTEPGPIVEPPGSS